jgi:hypothetical protein
VFFAALFLCYWCRGANVFSWSTIILPGFIVPVAYPGIMVSKILRDLPFSQNQPLKSADDSTLEF